MALSLVDLIDACLRAREDLPDENDQMFVRQVVYGLERYAKMIKVRARSPAPYRHNRLLMAGLCVCVVRRRW